MLLVGHIIIALASVVSSAFSLVAPSRVRINTTYGLTALTLASGTYLVISTHSPLLSSCVSGLVFVGLALSGALLGRRRLAKQEVESEIRRKY